jgi:hypothetical protein
VCGLRVIESLAVFDVMVICGRAKGREREMKSRSIYVRCLEYQTFLNSDARE